MDSVFKEIRRHIAWHREWHRQQQALDDAFFALIGAMEIADFKVYNALSQEDKERLYMTMTLDEALKVLRGQREIKEEQ
jgi:hypothetical protein